MLKTCLKNILTKNNRYKIYKKIIDILTMNQINFKEINTVEGDLEDVFIKVINNK